MTNQQITAYFERIGLAPSLLNAPRDYELLKAIQYAHVTTVPYENLDIVAGRPLVIEPDALFDKIVTRRRGGYCFELNGLLGELLRSLGFTVYDYMARYLRGSEGIPMRRHRVIVAEAKEGRVLCDVGIGDRAARYPIPLRDGTEQPQFDELYKFESDPFYGHVLCDFHRGEWGRQFAFTEEEQLDIDYVMPSFYCEKHPDSPFNKEYIISLKTPTGRKTVSGNVFRVFDGERVSEQLIADKNELDILIERQFGLKKE